MQIGSRNQSISTDRIRELIQEALTAYGSLKKVLILPPDFTRFHSGAGEITQILYELLSPQAKIDILPALGTHDPMTDAEITKMFGDIPKSCFLVHDWREGISELGPIDSDFIKKVSDNKLSYSITAEVSRWVKEGGYDRIFSVGQVVPHEVIGMANHNKNLFVGTGGQDTINKTHFLGAVAGMEKVMGKTDSPVRRVLNEAENRYAKDLPLTYILTVRSTDENRKLHTRGFYMGEGDEGFKSACELSREVNLDLLDEPLKKVVVYLDPEEFKSTWLGNKAIYRTRMAIADNGELIILAPGVKKFGEREEIDHLIRKYGYRKTEVILEKVDQNQELQDNLSAAAHLIHGSSEGRFKIRYAAPLLSEKEVTGVGYEYAQLDELIQRYDPIESKDGWNQTADGEDYFFISNPALGLWALRSKF